MHSFHLLAQLIMQRRGQGGGNQNMLLGMYEGKAAKHACFRIQTFFVFTFLLHFVPIFSMKGIAFYTSAPSLFFPFM